MGEIHFRGKKEVTGYPSLYQFEEAEEPNQKCTTTENGSMIFASVPTNF